MKRNHRQVLHAIIASMAIVASLLVILMPNMSLQWGIVVLFLLVLWLAIPSKRILKSCPSCGSFKKQTYRTLPLVVVPYSEVIQTNEVTETTQGWKGTLTTITRCANCSMERVNTVTEFVKRKQAPSLDAAQALIEEKLNIKS